MCLVLRPVGQGRGLHFCPLPGTINSTYCLLYLSKCYRAVHTSVVKAPAAVVAINCPYFMGEKTACRRQGSSRRFHGSLCSVMTCRPMQTYPLPFGWSAYFSNPAPEDP